MKQPFVDSLIALFKRKPFIFLTGDLGFNMLEPLRDVMGKRFINCGVAEQNMVGMAAGMAGTGESVWVYSIGPFLYARAFEQIRNDVCFHNLPVKLVGMGAGYGYGYLGSSHWALEDYGVLLSLPNMRCYMPAFDEDVAPIIERMDARTGPSWLRLGRSEKPEGLELPGYEPIRSFGSGGKRVALVGSIAGGFLSCDMEGLVITEYGEGDALPRADLYVEEHVRHGSLAQVAGCKGLHAHNFPHGPYGTQQFMRKMAGLTLAAIREELYGA